MTLFTHTIQSLCRKTVVIACLLGAFNIATAQFSDCYSKLEAARKYKEDKDYKNAISMYQSILNTCQDFNGNIKNELAECKRLAEKQKSAFALNGSTPHIPGEGGSVVLQFNRTPDNFYLKSKPDWLEVIVDVDGKRVTCQAKANPSAAKTRSGKIVLKSSNESQEYRIVQEKGSAWFKISKDTLFVSGGGGQIEVPIEANFDLTDLTIRASDEWLGAKIQGQKIFVNCSANKRALNRNATIEITGKGRTHNLRIIQSDGDSKFSVYGTESDVIKFDSQGGTNDQLKVNCKGDWKVKNSCEWLSVTAQGDGIRIECTPNPWANPRTGSFEIISTDEDRQKTILVGQSGAEPMLEASSLPLRGAERQLYDVRPHYRAIHIKGNKGDLTINVRTNIRNWSYSILGNEHDWIEGEEFREEKVLQLKLENNNEWGERIADVVIYAKEFTDTIHIVQSDRGYRGITDDYFEHSERTWKNTHFFIDLCALESFGFRMGGLAKRWKYVEASMLNFDFEYDHQHFDFKNGSPKLSCNWEPVVRGFLPLSRNDQRWSVFVGLGVSVNLVQFDVKSNDLAFLDGCNFLFEIGGEFHWKKKDNVSSRIFYRYNGLSTIGFSFDFHDWKPNNIKPGTEGYKGLLFDYFDNNDRAWKTTNFFFEFYALECVGIRLGGYAKRWKFVEMSLINFDIQYIYPKLFFDWEPIIRGFLPVSRTPERWAVFAGIGVSVNILNFSHDQMTLAFLGKPHVLFEMGAEYHWKRKPNMSSRIFYRYDGYSSIGFSFDLHRWNAKW